MTLSLEVEDALRRTTVSIVSLLELHSGDASAELAGAFHAALETASRVLERANSPVIVYLAQARIEASVHEFHRARAGRQQARENELKTTARLLTETLLGFRGSNDSFAEHVLDSSERIERLVADNELQALPRLLSAEMNTLRAATVAKQQSDAQELQALSERIGDLESRLAQSATEARRDPLTGLFNRGAWDQRKTELEVELSAGRAAYVLARMDLDHFKLINSSHGLATGDRMLARFGEHCRHAFGDDDFVARYDADEFVALIAAPTRDHAIEHVTRLMTDIRSAGSDATIGPKLTVSLGLVQPRADEPVGELLRRSNIALYDARHAGGDRFGLAA